MIQLKAWEPNPHSEFKIYADLTKKSGSVEVAFLILGPVQKIAIESPQVICERRRELWTSLCFEVFIGSNRNKDEKYFELNFASSGHWNIYQLSGYRKDLQEVASSPIRMLHHEIQKNSFLIKFQADLEFSKSDFFGPTLVLETTEQQKSYWAAAVIGEKPDFHLPEIRIF